MEKLNQVYVKRSQKDYSLSCKHQMVGEVESGELSIKGALRKYGTFDRELQVKYSMEKSPNSNLWN